MTLTTYTFGFRLEDVDEVAKLLAPILNVKWEHRSSDFWVQDYFRYKSSDGNAFRVYSNQETTYPHEEEEWTFPEYKDYPVLLELRMNAPIVDEIKERILTVFQDKAVFIDVL